MYLISLENFYFQFHTEPCISTSHTYTPGNNTLAKQYQIQRENRVRFSHGVTALCSHLGFRITCGLKYRNPLFISRDVFCVALTK